MPPAPHPGVADGEQWKPVHGDDLEINEVGDGLVVFRAATGNVHCLNNTAAAVFVLCTGEHSVTDVVAEVARSFALADSPAGDVVRCIDELMSDGLIR